LHTKTYKTFLKTLRVETFYLSRSTRLGIYLPSEVGVFVVLPMKAQNVKALSQYPSLLNEYGV